MRLRNLRLAKIVKILLLIKSDSLTVLTKALVRMCLMNLEKSCIQSVYGEFSLKAGDTPSLLPIVSPTADINDLAINFDINGNSLGGKLGRRF